MVRDQADTVRQLIPETVREHLRSMDEDVRGELKKAAIEKTETLAADVIKSCAQEQIQTTVEQLIPSMVEEQIKAEIRRLTQAE